MGGYRLGVDFGTSSTVAVLADPDGRVKPLLFDGSPLLPSGVFAGPDAGPLLAGTDAERAASAHPAGFEANPKRRIDDRVIWLAEREVAVADAITAVLTRVGAEAGRVAGQPPDTVVVTHPAGWSQTRLSILATAAKHAQLGECAFVAEPVAAAAYFADVLGNDLPVGRCLVVYDLGAGTCDVSIIRRTEGGLEVVATAGLDDVGGLDLDATIVAHTRSATSDADAWGRLEWPQIPADQRAHQLLWRDARTAKEQLSRHASADLHIPLVDTVVHVTRDEFESAARPHLDRTVDLTATLLGDTRVPRQDIAGIFLVGGSSRVPLVASLLHRALRIAPTALDHPELVVAEGALHASTITDPPTQPAGPVPPADALTDGADTHPTDQRTTIDVAPGDGKAKDGIADTGALHWPRWRPRTPRDRVIVAGAAALVLVIIAGLWTFRPTGRPDPADGRPQATATPTGQNPSQATATPTGQPSLQATSHTGGIHDVAFSPDGKTIATASFDNTARLWKGTTGESTAVLIGHTDYVNSVAFSPDGKILATASFDDTVRLWDVTTGGATAGILAGHTDWVLGVAFSPDGKALATASRDETVRLWDVATRKTTASLLGHTDNVNSVAFSPDGRTLASASEDETVRLWDVPTGGATVGVLTGHTDWINNVVFSPDGRTLATASDDETVRLWDVATRKTTATLKGTGSFYDVAFSPNGKTLATANADNTVRLWDLTTRKTTATLTGHTGNVNGVAFSPDGRTLASGSTDGTVRRWKIGA